VYAAIVYASIVDAIVYGTLLLCTVLLCGRKEEEVNEFVSAVCWKQNSNVIVAANSQGTIKVSRLSVVDPDLFGLDQD
jgi:hypothetical protein